MHQNYSLAFNSRRKNSKGKKTRISSVSYNSGKSCPTFLWIAVEVVYSSFCKRVVLGSTVIKQPFLLDTICAPRWPLSLIAKWYWPMPAAVTGAALIRSASLKWQSCKNQVVIHTEEHLANTCNEYCNYSTISLVAWTPKTIKVTGFFHYFIFFLPYFTMISELHIGQLPRPSRPDWHLPRNWPQGAFQVPGTPCFVWENGGILWNMVGWYHVSNPLYCYISGILWDVYWDIRR